MCAIFGVVGNEEAAHLTYLGLHALQHRGQEGAGIVSTDGNQPYDVRKKGLVADVFHGGNLGRLKGAHAIGHTRYSTTGRNTSANLQPLLMKSALGWLSMAHNGNLVNAASTSCPPAKFVSTTTGIVLVSGSAFSLSSTSRPFISGIMMSRIINVGLPA